MKIIETRLAPNPRRVRIFLAEKGIIVPFEELDLMKKELQTEEFSRINPLQRVPVLVLDDGTAITESVAICRYFEEIQSEPALFGYGPLGRAKVEMWNRRMDLGLLFHVAQVFRHLHPAMAQLEIPQVKDWAEANRPRAIQHLEIMNRQLEFNRYLAGDTFSIADITGLVAVDFMRVARIARPAGLTHLDRWHSEVSARPSAKA
jgi:glutathione S-transferase